MKKKNKLIENIPKLTIECTQMKRKFRCLVFMVKLKQTNLKNKKKHHFQLLTILFDKKKSF